MKRLIPCIYLYKEKAVKNFSDMTVVSENPVELAKTYSENAADELIVFNMSKGDEEHEKALDMMKEICSAIEIPVIGAGNVMRMGDIKKILYTGCERAVLNYDKEENIEITEEVSRKFGKDRIIFRLRSLRRSVFTDSLSTPIFPRRYGLPSPAG